MVSVVPTYRPTTGFLDLARELTRHGPVVVSDDASPCTADPLLASIGELSGVTLFRHQHNAGIARGLNDGLQIGASVGGRWLLTVDQDTVLGADYVTNLLTSASDISKRLPCVAAVAAAEVTDGQGRIRYPVSEVSGVETTPEVIQTGTLWRIDALLEIGGFDESLGIDAVDAAACVRLRAAGYLIAVAPGVSLQHSIGSSRTLHAFGRHIMVTGHSPERRTTMLRNRLRLFPEEYAQSPRQAFRTLRRVLVNQTAGLVLESGRKGKALGSLRGLRRADNRSRSDTLEP